MGNERQKILCKFCATSRIVQMLCKTKVGHESVQKLCKKSTAVQGSVSGGMLEAFNDNAPGTQLRADAIPDGELRKAARAAGVVSFQEYSLVDRAEALPKLEAYLRQQFPGDNSIDQRRVLEDFSKQDEPKTPTAVEQSARAKQGGETLRRIAAQNPGISELQNLVSVGAVRGASGQAERLGANQRGSRLISAAERQALRELDRVNGTHTILVDTPGDNSIDHHRALEDFSIQDESKTPTTAEQSARAKQDTETLRRIVSSRPGLRELVGLTVVGDGAGTLRSGRGAESGGTGQAATRRFQSKDGAELERVFGVFPHASVRGDDCFTRKMATCGGAWFQFGFFGFWDALKNLVAAAAHDQMAAVGERYTAAARADFVVGGFHRCRGIKSPEI